MAQHEHDREDLLREATALVERIEMRIAGFEDAIVAGFRRDGAASFYFGPETVLQFNPRGELRRGYWSGLLIKAENGQLSSMEKVRGEATVTLVTRPLSVEAMSAFSETAKRLLITLRNALDQNKLAIVGQVPADRDVSRQVADWLKQHGESLVIAKRPNVEPA